MSKLSFFCFAFVKIPGKISFQNLSSIVNCGEPSGCKRIVFRRTSRQQKHLLFTMQRAIGHKSSSSREGDYQLVGARPAWAARLVKKTADDQFRQFEERIATFVSARFAEEAHTQQQREAMYAHCLIIPLLFEVGREGSNMTSQVREEQLVGFFCFPFWHTLGSFSDLVSFLVVGFLCGSFVVV